MTRLANRVFLIVLDSVGIGAAPDAEDYGDEGAATLQHCASACGGLRLPTFQALGLGNIPDLISAESIQGIEPTAHPLSSFGAMRERSKGKDTITGHWEIAGLDLNPGFKLFPTEEPAFPEEITAPFVERTGRPILGNRHGSGTRIVEELGEDALTQGAFIVYTSADSVFQIAAHTDVIPLEELYAACEIARELCNPFKVGRVIARPFVGSPGAFTRTKDRKDYAYPTEENTILQHCAAHDVPVYSVGKIEDIFANRGITQGWHTASNTESMAKTRELIRELDHGFVFANFIDFDMLYGHRRDPAGYGRCLEETDAWLAAILPDLRDGDILMITADHGNDPTFKGTDHTREYVPLLVTQPGQSGETLGIRDGFYDIAQSIAEAFALAEMPRGRSFL